ncbi:MAG: ABC transporter permease [Bacillota bacterium]|nr:ABC transporter permease [Bacillota bacterium]MDI7249277.1 ABC transporter permease [Bacillota bacterium]
MRAGTVVRVLAVTTVAVGAALVTGILGLQGGFRAELKGVRLPPAGSVLLVTAQGGYQGRELFTPDDLQTISRALEGQPVRVALESRAVGTPTVIMHKEGESLVVHEALDFQGMSRDGFAVRGYRLAAGRLFTAEEEARGERVAVVGAGLARRRGLTVGAVVSDPPYITESYRVVGILVPTEERTRTISELPTEVRAPQALPSGAAMLSVPAGADHTVFVPLAGLPTIHSFNRVEEPPRHFHLVAVVPEGKAGEWLERLPALLSDLYPGVRFTAAPALSAGPILERVEEKVGAYFAWAAAIVLMIGVLSVTNVVHLMVLRRARVIGIKHALGASAWGLVFEYFREALLLTGLGAGLGLAGGWFLAPRLGDVLGQQLVVGWRQAGYSALIELGCGLAAAVYPAVVAVRLPPVAAIHGGALAVESGRGWFRPRDALAVLAVCAGTGALIFAVALGDLTSRGIEMYLRGAGRDLVFVTEPDPFLGGPPARLERSLADRLLVALAEDTGHRPAAAWEESFLTEVAGQAAEVLGVSEGYVGVRAWKVSRGRDLQQADFVAPGRVAVIGARLARVLFADVDPLGQYVRIADGPAFRVVGVLDEKPPELRDFGVNRDWCVLVPAVSLSEIPTSGVAQVTRRVVMTTPSGWSPEGLRRAAEAVLTRMGPGLQAITPAAFLRGLLGFQEQVGRGMTVGGVVALLAAGMGITSVSLMRVVEKTREVAIRRAVGAARGDIMAQYLSATFRLALGGSVAGLAAGTAAAEVIAVLRDQPTGMSVGWGLLALGVAVALAGLFGMYPAYAATAVDPVEILREE